MKLKVYSFLVFLFCSCSAFAQYSLSGKVVFQQDSVAMPECTVYLNDGKKVAITDSKGHFVFKNLANGTYTLHAVSDEGKYSKTTAEIADKDLVIEIAIDAYSKNLDEVVVTDNNSDFGFTRMNAVESLGIYEGKKTEVIIPDQLVANTATNSSRQVYSRVAGLNIFENDASGLQLGIGGRGLDPNRTSNFNVRQNGYDISADALGYPESYYTPPIEAVGKIQIVRGAASLQYGTQFGGLINFVMKKPVPNKKIELTARQTLGSYGFYNAFTSASGTVGKLSYYTFFQYKKGDGWRLNSEFDSHTFYSNINYQATKKMSIGIDFTQMDYLAHQPGGLTEGMFRFNPQQSRRDRNWFKVNWNLLALHFTHKFNTHNEFNLRLFGLSAYRYSLGFRKNGVATIDENGERDLIKGDFENWGAEARYLKHYSIVNIPCVFLLGTRYYKGYNHSLQGYGSTGKGADFDFVEPESKMLYDYRFPNQNVSAFAEHILYLHEKFSVTPGIRYEYIYTRAEGFYGFPVYNSLEEIRFIRRFDEQRSNGRQFVLGGLGLSYKPFKRVNVYGNISQNYRSITFSDMRIANPSFVIDPDMKDESGYSIDFGVRSEKTSLYNYDVSVFYLNYDNRIGEAQFYNERDQVLRRRGNIGQAVIMGIESYAEADFLGMALKNKNWGGVLYANVAYIKSEYVKSEVKAIVGKQVEYVPKINLKSGLRLGYKKLKGSFQYTYLSDQFTDATNAEKEDVSAVTGLVPAYSVMDVSLSYEFKWFKLETSVMNLTDKMYFTRRATGYPGPGILPSDGRTFYVTLQVKI